MIRILEPVKENFSPTETAVFWASNEEQSLQNFPEN
jgi:hypothetical protein